MKYRSIRGVLRPVMRGVVCQVRNTGGVVPTPTDYEFDFTLGSLPSGAVIARSSGGTYFDSSGVLSLAGNDVARFDYAYNGSSWVIDGLLVEPMRTNMFPNTKGVSSANGWSNDGTVSGANAVTSFLPPDGVSGSANAGARVIASAATSRHATRVQFNSQTIPQPWSASMFLNPGTYAYKTAVFMAANSTYSNNVGAGADLVNGTVTARNIGTGSGAVAKQRVCGADWRRIMVSGTPAASGTTLYAGVQLLDAVDATSFLGDGTTGPVAWGGQVEVGAFPTSLIITSGVAATRQADVLTLSVDDGTYTGEVVTPDGSYNSNSNIVVSGGEYEFDWADFAAPAGSTVLRSLALSPV